MTLPFTYTDPNAMITYSVPLRRDGMFVELQLPASLTKADAERLKRFIDSVALPDGPEWKADVA